MTATPRSWPVPARWTALVLASAVLAGGLQACGLPAGLLIGPLLVAAVFAAVGAGPRIPMLLLAAGQVVVGLMIASRIPPSLFAEAARDWPVFSGGVVSVMLAAALLGGVLARMRLLDGTTAVWGTMPGAATVMTLMSESFGADPREVALMQYLRVVCVVLATTLVSACIGGASGGHAATAWFPPVLFGPLAAVLLIGGIAAAIGLRLRVPAGALLLPMLAGLIWHDALGHSIPLPPWLLAPGYAVVGWTIGLRFTGDAMRRAARTLPKILAAIAALMAVCALLGCALHAVTGETLMSCYLATSPGGADSVAIIAAGTPVNVPFVMTMQVCRFLLLLAVGPAVARGVARLVGDRRGAAGPP